MHRDDRGGDERKPEAGSRQHAAREHGGRVAAARADPAEQQQSQRRGQHSRRECPASADPRDDPRRAPGRKGDAERHRDEGETGLQGVEAEHLLHVERQEEPHHEHGGVEREHHGVCGAQLLEAEDRQRHERRPREPALHAHERCQQREPGCDRDEDAGGAPAERVGADDAEHERDEAGGDEQRTAQIEMPTPCAPRARAGGRRRSRPRPRER